MFGIQLMQKQILAFIKKIANSMTFAAFLRFDELAKLVRCDVKIENDMLKLFIQSSKTDQYRDGAWIVVASSRKATCPVAMMNRYLDFASFPKLNVVISLDLRV